MVEELTQNYVRLADVADVPDGAQRVFARGDTEVLVVRQGETFFALRNCCSHDDTGLAGGPVQDGQIECHRHGARFDLRTGAATRLPAISAVETFPVKVEEGGLWVRL